MLVEFFYLFIYLLGCFFLVILLLFCSLFFVNQNPDVEKLSAYECGFNPFEDARSRFEVRFFLVGILFIVFDLEVSYLLPWVLIFKTSISFCGYFLIFVFLFILFFSFFFE